MGLEIERADFDEADRRRFSRRLADSLDVLGALLERRGFGLGEPSLGAELEVSLVGDDGRPVLRNILGGLSGPAIRPIALRMVWQASRAVRIPICGIGGIMTAEDAVKFLLCGATAVQVGTANYLNPLATVEIADGIAAYAWDHGFERVASLTGALELPGD